MPDRKTHARVSRKVLGHRTMREWFQGLLDEHSASWGPYHRTIDHTWERMGTISKLYGEVGFAEWLIHIALDYDLMPGWK